MLRLLLQPWLNLLVPSFFGIGQGPSSQELNQYGNLGGIGNFGTSTGEADIGKASDFWQGVLSGDQTKLSKLLGTQYSAINQRGQQQMKTLSEFGTRSGGTAAQQQQIGDTERQQAGELEGNLTGAAAGELGSLGSGLLSTGLSADEAAFSAAEDIQQQHAAKMNDIFKSISNIGQTVALIA
jgi:hypothetical protein